MTVRCGNCGAEFEDDDTLEAHREQAHSGTEDAEAVGERLRCPTCGAEMSTQANLEIHMHDAHAA
jgi:uncharacterized C2H2 Zn-finger protein